ncbi:MAG: hypothetical protein K1060chlam1_01037 [Candidatus Anoxychlamydiales bacterium]|nr:hypothetical protein [Candidatus Anoxychlamydiales bacterium]
MSSSSSSVSMQPAQLSIPLTYDEREASLGSLECLPDELLLRILSFLSINAVVGASNVSRFFMLLLRDKQVVKALYKKDSEGCSGLGELAGLIEKAKKTYTACSMFTDPTAIPRILAKRKQAQANKLARLKFDKTALIAKSSRAFSDRLSTSADKMGAKDKRKKETLRQKFKKTSLLVPLPVRMSSDQRCESTDKMNKRIRSKRKREYLVC